jgi:hypothetical protein
MRKQGFSQWRKNVEAEFMLPLADVVRGFVVEDGHDLDFTAETLEVRPALLRAWCNIRGLKVRNVASRREERVSSPTRAASVSLARRTASAVSWQELGDITGAKPNLIRCRWRRNGGNLRAALDKNYVPGRAGRRTK